tara:strand:- start:3594 stop:4112 length:519 start_codon:yes stop_codon:yes gene_type:complete
MPFKAYKKCLITGNMSKEDYDKNLENVKKLHELEDITIFKSLDAAAFFWNQDLKKNDSEIYSQGQLHHDINEIGDIKRNSDPPYCHGPRWNINSFMDGIEYLGAYNWRFTPVIKYLLFKGVTLEGKTIYVDIEEYEKVPSFAENYYYSIEDYDNGFGKTGFILQRHEGLNNK